MYRRTARMARRRIVTIVDNDVSSSSESSDSDSEEHETTPSSSPPANEDDWTSGVDTPYPCSEGADFDLALPLVEDQRMFVGDSHFWMRFGGTWNKAPCSN